MNFKHLKYLYIILITGIFIAACNNDHTSGKISENQLIKSTTDLGSSSELKNSEPDRKDNLKRRINEDLSLVKKEIDQLDGWLKTHTGELNAFSRSRFEQLRSDLVRIERNLKTKLNDLESFFWRNMNYTGNSFQKDLEKTEDEIQQINEQIDEWYETTDK